MRLLQSILAHAHRVKLKHVSVHVALPVCRRAELRRAFAPPGRLASFTHAGFTHAGFTCADIDALPLPKTATGTRQNLQ